MPLSQQKMNGNSKFFHQNLSLPSATELYKKTDQIPLAQDCKIFSQKSTVFYVLTHPVCTLYFPKYFNQHIIFIV